MYDSRALGERSALLPLPAGMLGVFSHMHAADFMVAATSYCELLRNIAETT